MGRIRILPDTLCNQIAAGEVVERPAAVVKELVENSLDAGSRRISVSLLQGGRREIRVTDNGAGMSPDDALLALERHATSKIAAVEDLDAIKSLGFRGEAIPSIAAVSRFELSTREQDAVSGTVIRVEGGTVRDVRETGCPAGTLITVRDLFYNVPARRSFLRSVDTEMAHIGDQFLRLSMAHPSVHFQLFHQERLQYDFPQTKTLQDRAGQILGVSLCRQLRPFSLDTPDVALTGLAGPPDLQRANGQSLFVYVNGRPVWDRAVNRAILRAYESLIPRGKYPVVALFLNVRAGLVDVNVHPTKREVRFRNPGDVIEIVRQALLGALERPAPHIGVSGSPWLPPPRPVHGPATGSFARETQIPMMPSLNARRIDAGPPPGEWRPEAAETPPAAVPRPVPERDAAEPPVEDEPLLSQLPVIGQLACSYILLEAPDGLVLIDQHAAHERILFNHLSAARGREAGQRLTRSVVLELFPKDAVVLRRWIGQLGELGFDIEPFGGDSFVIQAVPAVLSGYPPEKLIREMIESAHEDENGPRSELLAGLAKTAACHSAVRAGQRLKPEEIRSLLQQLDRARTAATCPHGRPVTFRLSLSQIAHLFHRT
ncbi:MAG: DNA mismatch repair endonuclease MutL [Desulfobacteraceae bacterium]|nr:DNA mismatch repair endonuclease MutL [Desulfobacteraceae bacterium]